MNTLFLCIVIFLIILAVFDLVVGVSNDAVNFLNSAIGAKVARFRTIVIIASIGVPKRVSRFFGCGTAEPVMVITRSISGLFFCTASYTATAVDALQTTAPTSIGSAGGGGT